MAYTNAFGSFMLSVEEPDAIRTQIFQNILTNIDIYPILYI